MYKRTLETYLKTTVKKYKAISIIGPRQAGKTTLAQKCFPKYEYISLEDPDIKLQAEMDPRSFLGNIRGNCIIDEIQHYPDLLSYLQSILDNKKDTRKFVLTGSNSLLLSAKISQSLAGRSRIIHMLPLQQSEITNAQKNLDDVLYTGHYPRIHHENLNPSEWLGDYYNTYVEKDVRQITKVENLRDFDRFVRVIAGRVGQLVNFDSIASDVGISQPTAKNWLSILEASYIAFTLQPHFKNFSKRIIKSPKLYFYDTGLLCYLLRIKNSKQLQQHPLKGSIFENFVILEKMKGYLNSGKEAPLYFWRDQHGHEVDLVIDEGTHLDLIEIKAGQTFNTSFLEQIKWLNKLQNKDSGTIFYGGNKSFSLGSFQIESWKKL